MNFNLALLLLITMVWGTTFPLLKSAATTLSGLEISAIRSTTTEGPSPDTIAQDVTAKITVIVPTATYVAIGTVRCGFFASSP